MNFIAELYSYILGYHLIKIWKNKYKSICMLVNKNLLNLGKLVGFYQLVNVNIEIYFNLSIKTESLWYKLVSEPTC